MAQVSQDSALFLIIILVTTGFNLLIVAALIADTNTNRSIRVILVNFLLSGVVLSIAIIIYDSFVFSDLYVAEGFSSNTPWWQVVVVIFYFGGTGCSLFATMYAVIMFIQVRFWEKPIAQPSGTKYFAISAVAIWIVAFLAASPLISRDIVYDTIIESCNCFVYSITFVVLYSVFFSILPAVISLIVLIVTVYYYKRYTIDSKSNDRVSAGLLKFAFFLLVVQTINVIAYVLLPIMYLNLVHALFDDTYFSFGSLFDAIHLIVIPTPIFILIFIKPVRDILSRWGTCSCFQNKCAGASCCRGPDHPSTQEDKC